MFEHTGLREASAKMISNDSMPTSRFLRQAGSYFVKLAGLDAIYKCWSLFNEWASVGYLHGAIALLGGAAFMWALLIAPAVFFAAANHFDLFGETAPETRKRDWTRLALLGLAACLAPLVGIPLSEYLLDVVAPDRVRGVGVPGADYTSAGLLVPVAVGIIVVIMGVAGAAVGRATQLLAPSPRNVLRWLAIVAMAPLFWVPMVFTNELVRFHDYPPVLIVLGPSLLPVLATCFLVRSQGYGVLEVLGLARRPAGWLDDEAFERVLEAVIREGEEDQPSIEEVVQSEDELETAKFLRWLRQAAAPTVAVTDAEMEKIVATALATAKAQAAASASKSRASLLPAAVLRRLDPARLGELGLSWAVLATGLILLGMLADASPNFAAAATVAALGVVGQALLSRSYGFPVASSS